MSIAAPRSSPIEWSGLAAAIVARRWSCWRIVSPNFLTEFNLYVMLRSFCVGLLVAFAQMVTLGVGQMNLVGRRARRPGRDRSSAA